MPATVDGTVPGTLSWPRTCWRSSGMPYLPARYLTSFADERYNASVYQAPSAAKPSCSRPIDFALTYQLPACHATSLCFTCWATCPSDDRSVYCQLTYVGSCTRFSVVW
jgi:hypothetical protein